MKRLFASAVLASLCLVAPSCRDQPAPKTMPSVPGQAPAPGAERTQPIAASYDRGLDFLLTKQKDGIWASVASKGAPDPAFTAMCVTALYERPGGIRDADRSVADAGIAFVAQSFDDDGGLKSPMLRNYMTSVAVMGLVASQKPEHRPLVDKAVRYIKKGQFLDDENPTVGGIGYGSDNTRADLSNTQYALSSLRAAGVPESDPVFKNAVRFLANTQNRSENDAGEPKVWTDATGQRFVRSNDGGSNYFPGNSKAGADPRPDGVGVLRSYGSMTFALLRCYHLAGLDAKDGRVQAATDWIQSHWTLDRNPGMTGKQEAEGLYYYYVTIGRTMPLTGIDTFESGGRTVDWRAELSARLLAAQQADGSWVNRDAERWMEGDPVLCTTYALGALSGCLK